MAALAALDVRGKAVLPHTAHDSRLGAPDHATDGYFPTRAGAWLTGQHPALAGIDVASIDDTADGERPARTLLPGASIPVAGHLTGLQQLPAAGAVFTAVPPRVAPTLTLGRGLTRTYPLTRIRRTGASPWRAPDARLATGGVSDLAISKMDRVYARARR